MDASSPEMLRLAAMIRNTVVRVTGAIDEDLVQDVWVALLPLIPTWDSTRNDSLAGFLSSRCRGAVIGALRKRNAIEALCTWHRDTGRAARRPVVHVQVGMFGRNHLRDDGRRRGITWQWEIDRALTVADGTEVDDRDELVRAARSLTRVRRLHCGPSSLPKKTSRRRLTGSAARRRASRRSSPKPATRRAEHDHTVHRHLPRC